MAGDQIKRQASRENVIIPKQTKSIPPYGDLPPYYLNESEESEKQWHLRAPFTPSSKFFSSNSQPNVLEGQNNSFLSKSSTYTDST